MVLRRREEFHRFAVDERHHGSLFPAQAFFDDDLSPGVAKDPFLHDVGDCPLGLLNRRRDDNTLSCGKAVSFDDNGRAVFADELPGVLGVVENLRSGGRDAVLEKKLFAERLAAFELRADARRTENAQAVRAKCIGDTGAERRFGADHGQVDLLPGGELCDVVRSHAFGQFGDAGVAGRAEQFGHPPALGQFPDQRMLAPAAADHKHSHRSRGRNSR